MIGTSRMLARKCTWAGMFLWSTVLMTGLSACSVLPQNELAQSIRAYTIEPQLAEPLHSGTGSKVIHVAPITAASTLQTTRMWYVPRTYELSAFATSEWAAEPASLLDAWIIRAMEQSRRFSRVISGTSSRSADIRLDVELLVLRHEFLSQPSIVRVVLRAVLTELRSGEALASREFEYKQPVVSEDAYGGVVAVNQAIGMALVNLVDFSSVVGGG